MAKRISSADAVLPEDARRWRGPRKLWDDLVAVEELHEDPANTNTHDERSIAGIAAAYARFGQQRAIVIDAHGVVRAGNGQLLAARRLGWSHVAAIQSDLTGVELAAYAVADNRVAEFSERDNERLLTQLQAIASEEDSPIAATGYTEGEIAALLESAGDGYLRSGRSEDDGSGDGDSPFPADADGREYDESVADEVKFLECPSCGHRWPA